jgi:hypothetical protein
MILKEFESIYHVKLWVCVENELKNLNGLFYDSDDGKDLNFENYKKYEALAIMCCERKTDNYGVLIIFLPKFLKTEIIAHEASHAVGYICNHTGLEMNYGEATAYLMEWIVKCCLETKKEYLKNKQSKNN